MLRSLRAVISTFALAVIIVAPSTGSAGERSGLQEMSFTTGYGFSDRGNVQIVPAYARFAWLFPDVIDEPLARNHLNLKWFLEPWIAGVTNGQNAIEVGITPIGLKLEYDAGQQVVPFLIAGTGAMYTGLQGGLGLSGPFEFASFGGAGINLFLTDTLALSFSWRWRHMSNAGIKDPNRGLDTQFVLIGLDSYPRR